MALLVLGALSARAAAQDDTGLAKQARNPLPEMIILPIQNNTNLDYGPAQGVQDGINIQPLVRSLLFTASKLMAAGLPLLETLSAMTLSPAEAMGRPELSELKEGGPANITVLELLKEEVSFVDFFGKTMKGKEQLVCRALVNRGKVIPEKKETS